MERSISSLTFKGSILEAVTEAKMQKKLFLVFVSGNDGESFHLEQSTWMDSMVINSLSKYCIFLHLQHGSVDASQFSAIYPQKCVPCITAIGYNGVQLWQQGGYISPENLVASIEKAWLSLHIQETTATFLTAALASNTSEISSSSTNIAASSEERSSSNFDLPLSLTNRPLHDLETKSLLSEVTGETLVCESSIKNVEISLDSVHNDDFKSGQNGKSASSSQTASTSLQPVVVNLENTEIEADSLNVGSGCTDSHDNVGLIDQGSEIALKSPQILAMGVENCVLNMNAGASDSPRDAYNSSNILLNIRLLDGATLQEIFLATDSLRQVKDFVDRNQTSGSGFYDLAIPYPRKLFSEQDLGKTLLELGLFNRQALIVVPRRLATDSQNYFGQSVSNGQVCTGGNVDQSHDMIVGYWGYAKRLLSYINPFTYLGSSSNISSSAQGSTQSFGQDRQNQHIHNQSSETERSYGLYTQNTSRNGDNAGKSRQSTSSRFGSNIHTLRHDEDDSQPKDRNTFWNGNSTQYGGNDDAK